MTGRSDVRVVLAGITAAAILAACSTDAGVAGVGDEPGGEPESVELTESLDDAPLQAANEPPASDAPRSPSGGADAVAQCQELLEELFAREDDGRFVEAEFEDEEPSEEELERVEVPGETFDGSVRPVGERVAYDSFADTLDVTSLTNGDVLTSVELCFEAGVLLDEEDDESELEESEDEDDDEELDDEIDDEELDDSAEDDAVDRVED